MRTLTVAAETQLATRYGTEPLLIVAVSFGGNFVYFSDRDFNTVLGRVLDIADLDNVINISGNSSVSNVAVTFIDPDGYFKQLFDTVDFHKKPIRIYQYFPSTNFETDKILLFEGYMSTPIEYNEVAATLTVTGISKLEDIEIGFSPDNAIWRHVIPNEIESKAWPMPFGTPVNYPIPSITKLPHGSLVHGFGISDFTLENSIDALEKQIQDIISYKFSMMMAELMAVFSRDQCEVDALSYADKIESLQNTRVRLSQMAAQIGADITNADTEAYNADFSPEATELNHEAAIRAANTALRNLVGNSGILPDDQKPTGTFQNMDDYNSALLQAENSYLNDLVNQKSSSIDDLINQARNDLSYANSQASMFAGLAEQYHSEQISAATEELRLKSEKIKINNLLNLQIDYQFETLAIWNGKTFPQGREIWLKIGDCLVRGYFKAEGENAIADMGKIDLFYVNEFIHPQQCCYNGRHCTELGCEDYDVVIPGVTYGLYYNLANETERAMWQQAKDVFWETGELPPPNITNTGAIDPNLDLRNTRSVFTSSYAAERIGQMEGSNAGFAWISAGSKVRVAYSDPVEHVVSIIPCQVLQVSAYRTLAGQRHLTSIPSSWYTITTRDYGDGLIATILTLARPLSSVAGTNYEDEIYVTVTSLIGPNIVDVIRYLIERYLPTTTCDNPSFTQARIDSVYPSNFAILEQKNIIQVLSEICFQACLSLWYSEGVAYLRYLPNVPPVVTELTEDSIDIGSLKLSYSDTENIITKLVVTYRTSYDQEEPFIIAARYNVAKYGTIEETIDYYIYTSRDAVVHSLTFWLLRKGNTWRYITCTTALNTLVLENMDAVSVNLISGIDTVTGIIEESSYNSTDFLLSYKIWLPVRAGESSLFKFAYYNIGSLDEYFPEAIDWATGNGIGAPILRDLKIGKITSIQSIHTPYEANQYSPGEAPVMVVPVMIKPKLVILSPEGEDGGPPIYFPVGPQGDEPDSASVEYTPEISEWKPANINAENDALREQAQSTVISLYTTRVIDFGTDVSTTLGSLFRTSQNAAGLLLKNIIGVSDGVTPGTFTFKRDSSSDEYAAKLAYLKEETDTPVETPITNPSLDPPIEPANQPVPVMSPVQLLDDGSEPRVIV